MFAEGGEGGVEIRVGEAHFGDRIHRVHHGRVMFRKDLADFGKAEIEDVAN